VPVGRRQARHRRPRGVPFDPRPRPATPGAASGGSPSGGRLQLVRSRRAPDRHSGTCTRGESGRAAACFPRKRGKPLSSARCGCHEQSRSVACARHAPARRPQQSCRAARRTIAFHGKAVPAIRIPGLIARVTLLGKHNLLLCNSALIRSTVVTAVRPSDSACDVAWLGPSSFQRLTWIEVERMRQG
jgi:hypothetical protein